MPRSRLIAALALACCVLVAVVRPPSAVRGQAPPATPTSLPAACSGIVTSTLSSDTIRVCDAVTVTTHAEPICQACSDGVNVVYLQEYGLGSDWGNKEAVNSLSALQERQDAGQRVRVAVVHYGGNSVRTAVNLTDALPRAKAALAGGAPMSPWGNWVKAAQTAVRILRNARGASKPCEIVVFFASIKGDTELYAREHAEMLQASRLIRSAQIPYAVVCSVTSGSIDFFCLIPRQMASSHRYYVEHPGRGKLAGIIRSQLQEFQKQFGPELRETSLTHVLAPGLRYVSSPTGDAPSEVDVSPERTILRWRWAAPDAADAQTVTFRAAPLSEGPLTEGRWPIETRLSMTDTHRSVWHMPGQPITLTVAGSCATPSPTPTELPTETATSTATARATPSPIPTATETPTAGPRPAVLYLPVAINERCLPIRRFADIALVIDASTSMLEDNGTRRTKLEAAVAAARSFLDQLNLVAAGDQVAIVSFNSEAHLLQSLTSDRGALETALTTIVPTPLTCLVCGVAAGANALGEDPTASRTRVMILLTDGRSNPRPVAEAVERAAVAKAHGVLIFTVGLGDDLDIAALEAIASEERFFFRTPDATDLEGIYTQIAGLIPCPPGWPK